MGFSPESNFIPPDAAFDRLDETEKGKGSPQALRRGADFWLNRFCKHLETAGQKNLDKIRQAVKEKPEGKFIIASSHFCDLDAPAAIKVFGEDLDLQISADSLLFGQFKPERQIMMRAGGGVESFSPINHRQLKGGKQPVFEPENFNALEEKMAAGKTPWLAIHEFSTKDKMSRAKIGAIYLAQESGAKIIPTAVEFKGSNPKLGKVSGLARGLIKKSEIVYHIGEPIELEPIDVSPIKNAFEKRKAKIKLTAEERESFKTAHEKLKKQAEDVALIIAAMLPEEQRGPYQEIGGKNF